MIEPNLAYEVEFSGPDGTPITQIPVTEEMIEKHVAVAAHNDGRADAQ